MASKRPHGRAVCAPDFRLRPSTHTTSQQRRHNVVTLQRRCNDVAATLCACWGGPGFESR